MASSFAIPDSISSDYSMPFKSYPAAHVLTLLKALDLFSHLLSLEFPSLIFLQVSSGKVMKRNRLHNHNHKLEHEHERDSTTLPR
jgi:hypothetical protein